MKYAQLKPNQCINQYRWNQKAHIGSGGFGKVYLGKDSKQNNRLVAIKIMNENLNEEIYLQKSLDRELQIMKLIKGQNIVNLLEIIKTKKQTFLIFEFCNQGDFRGYLNKKKQLSADDAIIILKQIVNGFKIIVNQNIVHRDLKPENILIHDGIFKVADFGFSKLCENSNQMLQSSVGTPLYMSLQLLINKPYTNKCDIWALGLMLYEMIFGYTPWPCKNEYQLIKNIKSMPLKFPINKSVSKDIKNFLQGCLAPKESNRFSWSLPHKFFQYNYRNDIFNHELIKEKIVKDLKQQESEKEIKQEKMKSLFLKQSSISSEDKYLNFVKDLQVIIEEGKINIQQIFNNFDTSKNGELDIHEFTKFILIINSKLKTSEIEDFFNKIDVNQDKTITFAEFNELVIETEFACNIETNQLLLNQRAQNIIKKLLNIIEQEEKDLRQIFKKYDSSGDQNLDLEEFSKLLQEVDSKLTPQECSYVFDKFDVDSNKQITLQEFIQYLQKSTYSIGPHLLYEEAPIHQEATYFQQFRNQLKLSFKSQGKDIKDIFQREQKIDLIAFIKKIQVIDVNIPSALISEIFDYLDDEGNGYISTTELLQKVESIH